MVWQPPWLLPAITYMLVILGELVPKSLALERAGACGPGRGRSHGRLHAAGTSLPYHDEQVRQPGAARVSAPACGAKAADTPPKQLKLIVTASRRVGLPPEAEEEMIHNALELDQLTVREIMVPRHNIFSLSADMPLDEATAKVVEENIPAFRFTIRKRAGKTLSACCTSRTSRA